MKVRRYGHIHLLTFYAPILPINVQLFEHELGLVLIDTALERNAADILSYINELDKPLLAILLTHAHGDHVGGVDAIKSEHPLAELYMSRRDARLLSGDRSLDEDEQNKIRGSLPTIRSKPDRLIDPGERLFGLRVLDAAGHTPGSIAFYDESNRILFAGDAFQSQGGAAVAGDVRPLFPLPGIATWKSFGCRQERGTTGRFITAPDICRSRITAQRDASSLFSIETCETETGEKVHPLTGGLKHATERDPYTAIRTSTPDA